MGYSSKDVLFNQAKRKINQGFTLIELMIVVGIIGILVLVVYPSYSTYSQRAHRSEAMRTLAEIATLQSQFFADQRRYTTDLRELGLAGETITSETGHYLLRAVAIDDIRFDYEITATAVGTQATDDECALFGLNYINQKRARSSTDADTTQLCWEL